MRRTCAVHRANNAAPAFGRRRRGCATAVDSLDRATSACSRLSPATRQTRRSPARRLICACSASPQGRLPWPKRRRRGRGACAGRRQPAHPAHRLGRFFAENIAPARAAWRRRVTGGAASSRSAGRPDAVSPIGLRVAGASRGVGRGIARGLGEAGATVIVTGRSSESGPRSDGRRETIEDTARRVEEAGGKGFPYRCDHTSEREVDMLAAWVLRRFGRADVVCNAVWGGNEG